MKRGYEKNLTDEEFKQMRAQAEIRREKDTIRNINVKMCDLFAKEKDSLRRTNPKLFAEGTDYNYKKMITRYNDTIDGKRKVTFMIFARNDQQGVEELTLN